jgi:hypothetical protein
MILINLVEILFMNNSTYQISVNENVIRIHFVLIDLVENGLVLVGQRVGHAVASRRTVQRGKRTGLWTTGRTESRLKRLFLRSMIFDRTYLVRTNTA